LGFFFAYYFFSNTLTSNDVPYLVISGFIFSTDQSVMSLTILEVLKLNTNRELLSDCLICFTVNNEWKVSWHDPLWDVNRCWCTT